MSSASLVWVVLTMAVGGLFAAQSAINAQLAQAIGSAIVASAISFWAGAVLLLAVSAAVVRAQGIALAWNLPPFWTYVTGGAFGAIVVTTAVLLAPRLGVGTFMASLIAGQCLVGVALDHFGAFGLAVHEVSAGRIIGAFLVVAGVALVRFT